MFIFRYILIFFSLMHITLYATPYGTSISSASCSARTYHALKNELNLDKIYKKHISLTNYAAEAFLSNHIYSIDKARDIGEEFQFGKNRIAKLIDYETDSSGFVGGVYVLNSKKIVIAFAGTTGKEKFSDESALWEDVKTNVKLLSDQSTDGQIYSTITYIQRMQVKLTNKYPDYTITVTGHSLGGGLAQFASLASKNYDKYKKIKAITFNTAPMPLTNITKKWIEDVETQKTWSDNNNVNFMTNLDPLTLTLRFFENREKMKQQLNKRFKLAKGFSIDNVYDTVKTLLGISDSDKIKKLIYGKRIILSTNSGHSILTLIKKVFPEYASIAGFRDGYNDVKVTSSGLYCKLLTLMERHVISYPKKERGYNFEPNKDASIYEVSIFIVNAFYYDAYRKALLKNPNLTRYQYFLNHFNVTWNSDKGDPYRYLYLKNNFDTIYREIFNEKASSLNDTVINRCIQKTKDIVFWNQEQDTFTRGQMASWIVQSLKIDYGKIVKDVLDGIREENNALKRGHGSLRYDPPLKSIFINSNVYQFGN